MVGFSLLALYPQGKSLKPVLGWTHTAALDPTAKRSSCQCIITTTSCLPAIRRVAVIFTRYSTAYKLSLPNIVVLPPGCAKLYYTTDSVSSPSARTAQRTLSIMTNISSASACSSQKTVSTSTANEWQLGRYWFSTIIGCNRLSNGVDNRPLSSITARYYRLLST